MEDRAKDRMFSVALVDPKDHESLYMSDVYEILIKRIGLRQDEIEGLQAHGSAPKVFDVMVKSLDIWGSRGIGSYIGRRYNLPNGRKVTVDTPYETLTQVIVKGVPMFWNREKMLRLFSWYGKVKKLSRDSWRKRDEDEKQFNGTWNGSYKVTMGGLGILTDSVVPYFRPCFRVCSYAI